MQPAGQQIVWLAYSPVPAKVRISEDIHCVSWPWCGYRCGIAVTPGFYVGRVGAASAFIGDFGVATATSAMRTSSKETSSSNSLAR